MSPSGIEPATFRFVAQHLNHCATAVNAVNIEWKIQKRIMYLNRFLLSSQFTVYGYLSSSSKNSYAKCSP